MPIAAFGLWAGCVVFMNYILVITFFPAMLSWWYQVIKPKEKCCCSCCKSKKTDDLQPEFRDYNTDTKDGSNNPLGGDQPQSAADMARAATGEEPRCLETFLGETWANWNIKAAYIILPCVFIMLGFAAWKATQISPLTKQEQWFDEDHYMEKMFSCKLTIPFYIFILYFILFPISIH